jgi:hypothetical protein
MFFLEYLRPIVAKNVVNKILPISWVKLNLKYMLKRDTKIPIKKREGKEVTLKKETSFLNLISANKHTFKNIKVFSILL